MKYLFSALICSAIALFAGYSKADPAKTEFDTMVKAVPADSSMFFGAYCPADFQQKFIDAPGYKNALKALKENPAINEQLKLATGTLSQETNGLSEQIFDKNNPMKSLIDLLSNAEDIALVAFAEKIDIEAEAKAPQWTLSAQGKFIEIIGKTIAAEPTTKKIVQNERTFFEIKTDSQDENVFVSIDGKTLRAASSIERILAFEATLKNPQGKCVTDVPAFKKVQKGFENSNIVFFLNFDQVKGLREVETDNAFQKSLNENAESVGFFGNSCKDVNKCSGAIRITLKRPIYAMEFAKAAATRKLQTLKNALPEAEFALGIAVPALTPDVLTAAKVLGGETLDNEEIALAKNFDLQTLYISVKDSAKFANIGKTPDMPEILLTLTCGDVNVILENNDVAELLNSPMVAKEKLNGTEILSTVFGIKFSALGKNSFYASNARDSAGTLAIAQNTGTSLADTKIFENLEKTIAGQNIVELYADNKKTFNSQQLLEIARELNTAETNVNTEMEKWHNALVKKNLSAAALKFEDATTLTLIWACEYELDFNALAEEIKITK